MCEIIKQYEQRVCQTDILDDTAEGLQSDEGRVEYHTIPILMVDKECQTEDVVVITTRYCHLTSRTQAMTKN